MPNTRQSITHTFSLAEVEASLCNAIGVDPEDFSLDIQIGAIMGSDGPLQYEVKRVNLVSNGPEVTS